MEQRAVKKRRRRAAAAVVLVLVIATTSAAVVRSRRTTSPAVIDRMAHADTVHAPTGIRIKVEVLNTTDTRGLGRRATRWLRDGGFDVVFTGQSKGILDESLVLDRSGHPDWARQIARRLGGARVESRPDSSRYLDVTVLLGRSFRAPSQSLDP